MSIGRKEIILAAALGFLIYILVFVKFIWFPIMPQISEKSTKIADLKSQKEKLEKEAQNIAGKQAKLDMGKTNDERLDEYLLNNANIIDGIEYIEKLAAIMGNEITSVNIVSPVEAKTTGGGKYFELKMSFSVNLSYDEMDNFIKFIEGSSKKVCITSYVMKVIDRAKLKNTTGQTATALSGETVYTLDMSMSMYSLNAKVSNELVEYSKRKFNRYLDGNKIPYAPQPENIGDSGTPSVPKSTIPQVRPDISFNNSLPSTIYTYKCSGILDSDIAIIQKDFLMAGDNLKIYGINRPQDIRGFKTRKNNNISLYMSDSSYELSTVNDNGGSVVASGSVPSKEFIKLYLSSDFEPSVVENGDMGLNLGITNNSKKKIYITLVNSSGKVRITGASGNQIVQNSDSDRVYIL